MWVFVLKHWKLLAMSMVVIAYVALWGYASLMKAKMSKVQGELAVCQQVNTQTVEVVNILEAEVEKANKLCVDRLERKSRLIESLQRIEQLGGEADETVAVPSTDPVLTELNRLFP